MDEIADAQHHRLQHARAMHVSANGIALAAAGREARLEGTLRISASVATALYHLPPIIARIREAEPAIQIEHVPSDSSSNLLFRGSDIAVRMYRPRQLELLTTHLGDIELGLFGATSHLDRRGRPARQDELMEHDLVGHDANPSILDGFRAAGIDLSREWLATRCDDNAVYWELVRGECGLGFARASVGRACPDVEEIRIDLDLPTLPVWLTAHKAMRHTPRVRRVWDMLAKGLGPLVR